MLDIVQGLWIGNELSKLEQLSIQSFIDNGHEYHLYVYSDGIKNIPEKAVIKDGNEIIHKSEIYRYKNGSVSAFSNLFRFTLLYKKGGVWADTDLVCVKPLAINKEIVISTEPDWTYTKNTITSSLLKLPKHSDIAAEGVKMQIAHKKVILEGKMAWGSGPKTVNYLVNKYNLSEYVLPWRGICSCWGGDIGSLINKKNLQKTTNINIINTVNKIPEIMYGIHFWNEEWRQHNVDKNKTYDKECLYEILKAKHKI